MSYIYDVFQNYNSENLKIGKKAENLVKLIKNGFNVPYFSVITNEYFKKVILKEIRKKIDVENWNDIFESNETQNIEIIRNIIENHTIQNNFIEELQKFLKDDKYYAVRSSSIEEDSENFSFAGQFETFLYIKKEEMLDKIKKVWVSSFSNHVMKYRKEGNINNEINVPAVIIQEMVNSEKSGVAFSANPINNNKNEVVLSCVFGLGTSIVDGDEDGDLYIVNKNLELVSKEIKIKTLKQSLDFEKKSIKREKIHEEKEVLNEKEIRELVQNIINIEKVYGVPQDIEWAFENKKLYILQARPITTFESRTEKKKNSEKLIEENIIIWDNSNIVESYPEITLPLTFSFIKNAYAGVYKQFSKVVGISKKIMDSYEPIYANMLGILNGRVYYNLINWYKLLLLLPNSKRNSGFMEQMMGVKQKLSGINLEENLLEATKNMNFFEKKVIGLKKARAGFSIFFNMFSIEKKAKRFCQIIDQTLSSKEYNLSRMDITELQKYYILLENKFLKNWETPLINDFLVMIWFGISKKIIKKFIKNDAEEIHNILIAQKGENMISVEPSKYMEKLSEIIKKDTSLKEEIKNIIKNKTDIVTSNLEFNKLLNEYLEKFGDRTVHELKLESLTLRENPIYLFRMLYSLALKKEKNTHEKRDISLEQKKIYENLKIGIVKKMILKKSISNAKKFIKIRENLRYERTKAYGIIRKVFRQIGIHMKDSNIIENERDIFYLTINEIFGLIDASAIDTNLKEIVKIRKRKYEHYKMIPALPDRFLTKGFISEEFYYENLTTETNKNRNFNELTGTACSKGIVKGIVKVVLNPMETEVEEGDIVITKSTDPSWVMVFPLLKGLIVEKGSLLSHSAIISREMNIPAIVGVQNATTILKTGDYVEFDGSTGIIKKIDSKLEKE